MTGLAGKTLFITGASRGIGLAIALRAAREGANIAIAAKTEHPHPKLPGTIFTAAEEIEKAGGRALPLAVDTRGTLAVAKFAIDHLAKSANPHMLMISPPLDIQEKWFASHTPYSLT